MALLQNLFKTAFESKPVGIALNPLLVPTMQYSPPYPYPLPLDSESKDQVGNAEKLARFLFVLGHVAVKVLEAAVYHVPLHGSLMSRRLSSQMLVYLEETESKTKKLRVLIRSEEVKKAAKKGGKKSTPEDEDDERAEGASEEYEIEQMREEAERQMVELSSTNDSFIAKFGPLVVSVCSQPELYPHTMLQSSAVLALCKLMCASPNFCESNLRLLFTILLKAQIPAVRANVMVALGDMAFRFPNLIEPWSAHMYGCLKSEHEIVRKHALLVIIHLILNDMQKVMLSYPTAFRCTDANAVDA
jgi:condensin complex subunit 1